MTTIVTRAGKGSPLSWGEVDNNFTNLNTDKLETSSVGVSVQAHSSNLDEFAAVNPTPAGLVLLDAADATAQRNSLGLGNVDNTSDATKNSASVALTNKTISATTNTVEARSGPSVSAFCFRNKLINGNFDFWQRASSQTTVGYGSADRWYCDHNGSTKTASQQNFTLGQTAVPNEPLSWMRQVVTSVANAANYVNMSQQIEGVRTLAGKTATLSFYAKADANKNIAVEFTQHFGTGGSPSSMVTGIGAQLVSLTTTWTKYTITVAISSISGKILGSNNDSRLGVHFWFDAGSSFNSRSASLGQQSGTFDIAQVQVEEGTVATPFELRPYQTELALCQRYCQRLDYWTYTGYQLGGNGWAVTCALPVAMRTTPTTNSPSFSTSNITGTVTLNPGSSSTYSVTNGLATINAAIVITLSSTGFFYAEL